MWALGRIIQYKAVLYKTGMAMGAARGEVRCAAADAPEFKASRVKM